MAQSEITSQRWGAEEVAARWWGTVRNAGRLGAAAVVVRKRDAYKKTWRRLSGVA